MEAIRGDVLTEARRKRGDVEMLDGERGGLEFRTVQVPVELYFRRRTINREEYRAAERLFKDFVRSGQTISMTANLDGVRAAEKRTYLPATDMQREALDHWRKAVDSVHGKIGQLMILNVCCYGYWVNDMKYLPYDSRSAMCRFKEALHDLVEFYKNI